MRIIKEDVIYVAELARLELDEASMDKFAMQIDLILDYVNTLNEVKTEGVSPTFHAVSLTNAFRSDEERAHLPVDRALANAPETENGAFVVPKIVG